MDWLKEKISKKLFTAIATFMLNIIIVAGNKALGSPLDDASVITLVSSIVATAVSYIFAQGSVDKAKIQAKSEIISTDVANLNSSATSNSPKVVDFMEKM